MADQQHIRWLLQGAENWASRRNSDILTPDFSGTDLYFAFKHAGELDADGNIPLSEFDFSHANFHESRLCTWTSTGSVDLRKANLRSADFRGSHLTNAKLDEAVLIGTQLQGANLSGVSLCGSKLINANFEGADLSQADLSSANLRFAFLKDSRLSYANLSNADLTTANLTGTNLSCSRPWTAKLFCENKDRSKGSSDGLGGKIRGIGDLIGSVSKLRSRNELDCEIYFRGESKKTWELRPCVMRPGSDGTFGLRAVEGQMLLELMTLRPEDFRDAPTALDQWMLAQHYGLKTRLLDVTRNPLVALLGACGGLGGDPKRSIRRVGRLHVFSVPRNLIKPFNSDTITVLANFAKLSRAEQDCLLGWTLDEMAERTPNAAMECNHEVVMRRLYHLIRQERPHFMELIDPRDLYRVFVVEPRQSFERIRVQSSAFLISGFHERFERTEVLKWNQRIPTYDHYTLEIPANAKTSILEELRLLNITREALFPSLDEAANAVTGRYSR